MNDDNTIGFGGIPFNFNTSTPSIIKVIGVGGGGGNAVNHMYREGIHDVTYLVCNTDQKHLSASPVPNTLQLGEGLGAGNKPEVGRKAAEDSIDDIKNSLNDGTRMVFITAGMGGGTGTGAAPIVARCAKEAGILTVGIVTIPFKFEGIKKINQALDGVEEIAKHVDALLVINNERLREIYPQLTVTNAFAKADDTLCVAAKSIAEIITMRGIINMDFQDVTTVLKDGGVAIMSTGFGEGEKRVTKAIEEALNSPLLNNNDIYNSKKILLNVNFCRDEEQAELTMEEMNEIDEFMSKFREDVETKWGLATDSSLGNKVKITLLATGFGLGDISRDRIEPTSITSRKTQAEMEDEKNRYEERMRKFYGKDKDSNNIRRNHHVFIFSEENIDNEDVISMVENLPTYNRTKEGLKSITTKSAGLETVETEEDSINFNLKG